MAVPRARAAANTTDLSPVTAATAVEKCIARDPGVPVVLHWQLQAFPIRVAKQLLASGRRLVWIVATKERAEIAERELGNEGIPVHRVATEKPQAVAPHGGEVDMRVVRLALKAKAAKAEAARAAQFPLPAAGTVTVVPIQRLCHRRPLEEIAGWSDALVVFDHVGCTNTEWLTSVDAVDANGIATQVAGSKRTDDQHPIPFFLRARLPLVFLSRDEFEIALLRADFIQRQSKIALLSTTYKPNPKLATHVVATNLVEFKYSTGAFLSILASTRGTHVVGEGLIGAETPDRLSMSTQALLKKAVLRISNHSEIYLELARRQTGMTRREVAEMRMRDFIRTSVLAIDPTCRAPELVVLSATDLASAAAAHLNVQKHALSPWSPRGNYFVSNGTPFTTQVVKAATTFPKALRHPKRLSTILEAIERETKARRHRKVARLALALHAGAAVSPLDLAARPEDFAGQSERGDDAIGLFNKILDAAFPWDATRPNSSVEIREARRDILCTYRSYCERR